MESTFVNYLFNKNFFVAQESEHHDQVEIWMTLAHLFNIRVDAGVELLEKEMIETAENNIDIYVPRAFYEGFPASVKEMLSEQLIWDQIIHYTKTYGFGDFSEEGHSIFEKEVERKVFDEETEIKRFTVITEEEAELKIAEYVEQLLSGTRPLSEEQYELVKDCIDIYSYIPTNHVSKNTAIRLICDLPQMLGLTNFITLSDIPKLAEELAYRQWRVYPRGKKFNRRKIKLINRDRKLVTKILDKIIADFDKKSADDIAYTILPCFEQMARWSGLLHNIHYKPKNDFAKTFCEYMHGKENYSIMSSFENYMRYAHAEESYFTAVDAAEFLLKEKGQGAFLRNLDYILSKCYDDKEIHKVISLIDTNNVIMLYQLLFHYYQEPAEKRTFKYLLHNMQTVYQEKSTDNPNRKTRLDPGTRYFVRAALFENIKKLLYGRLGKVYISKEMKNIALPIQEATSFGGYGTLTRGSRIHIPEGKKIRAFTYWEKVDDIDLSVIGLDEKGEHQREFSWRGMWSVQSEAIAFSGDQVSGYDGGSEFFDINVEEFRKAYPNIRYLVFCNNVFSDKNFNECICRAGYMTRDIQDSGEIYEPKIVQSSFKIDCNSHFAYLFAIDLRINDFIWLNTAHNSNARVAGNTNMGFITQYFDILSVMNVYDFFAMQAKEIVDKPEDADIIVSDNDIVITNSWDKKQPEVIHSYDTERIMQLMNL